MIETPIYELNFPEEGRNRVYIKRDDLLPFSLGGNKVRIGNAFFQHMKSQDCDTMVIYGNSRSNLCRVLANLCFREKIPCYMICSSEEGEEQEETSNSRLMKWLGAQVIPCSKDQIAPAVEKTMDMLQQCGKKPYYIYGDKYGTGNEGIPVQAYVDAYEEICAWEERERMHFDYIFSASGTGATQSGLLCGHLLKGDRRRIVGISISRDASRGSAIIHRAMEDYFASLGKRLPQRAGEEICLPDQYRCGGYGKYDGEVLECVRDNFTVNGIPLDPTYTGKAFLGMKKYLRDEGITDSRILFLHTGGTPLFYDCLSHEGAPSC